MGDKSKKQETCHCNIRDDDDDDDVVVVVSCCSEGTMVKMTHRGCPANPIKSASGRNG